MNVLKEYDDVVLGKILKGILDSAILSNRTIHGKNSILNKGEFRKSKTDLMNKFNIDYFNYFQKNERTTAIIIKRCNIQTIYLYDHVTRELTK